MKIRAYAKINLGLNVLYKRDDGYHELDMVNAPITFYDELYIEKNADMVFDATMAYVKKNKNNSVLKAISLMRAKYGFEDNFRIMLRKNIPSRAGLGGGSADAAATIKAIDRLLGLNMSLADYKEIAMQIGSDEYYCLFERCARVQGTGDIVKPFQNRLCCPILLVKPYSGISTKASFKDLDVRKCDHPDIDAIKRAMEDGDYGRFVRSLGNSLEASSFILDGNIKKIRDELLIIGMDASVMSGSGSTVLGFSKDEGILDKAAVIMKRQGHYVRKVRFLLSQVDMLNR